MVDTTLKLEQHAVVQAYLADRTRENADCVIRTHRFIAERIAKRILRTHDLDQLDMGTVALEAVWHALRTYDETRGASFLTWFNWIVPHRIRDAAREAWGRLGMPNHRHEIRKRTVSLDRELDLGGYKTVHYDPPDPHPAPSTAICRRVAWRKVLKGLRRNQKLAVMLYYGQGFLMREVGTVLGVSESRASQLIDGALKQLAEMGEVELRAILL